MTEHTTTSNGRAHTAASLTCAALVALILGLAPATAEGKTRDGLTPAVETVCDDAGLAGGVWGLCNAYCEAMDCDVRGDDHGGCERVLKSYKKKARRVARRAPDTPLEPPCLAVDEPAGCPCWSEEEVVAATDACAAGGFIVEGGAGWMSVDCFDGSFSISVSVDSEGASAVCTKDWGGGNISLVITPDEAGACMDRITVDADPWIG